MAEPFTQSPGTVSKILWHFTGGPIWNAEKRKQDDTPKPHEQAYRNLRSILQSQQLRLGQYRESLTVIFSQMHVLSPKGTRLERNHPWSWKSAPVCCLADIPISHLAYHAHRYGKFAIGFHRDSVLKHGFNPVLYSLESSTYLRSFFEGFLDLACIDADSRADKFEELLAFIKTFKQSEFGTVYCEREWRSIESYSFTFSDLAMIVLPKKIGRFRYFQRFTGKDAVKLNLPSSVPIVPWEDLVEH